MKTRLSTLLVAVTAAALTFAGTSPAAAAEAPPGLTASALSPLAAVPAAAGPGGIDITMVPVGPLVEGRSGTLTVTYTAVHGDDWPLLTTWRVAADGRNIASGLCPQVPDPHVCTVTVPLTSLTGGLPGSPLRAHVLTAAMEEEAGGEVKATRTVQVAAAPTVTLTAPRGAPTGAIPTLTTRVLDPRGAGLTGVPITLQRRLRGTTSWAHVATKTATTALATATFAPVVERSTEWRAVVAAVPGRHGAATSRLSSTLATSRITLGGVPATAIGGSTPMFAATVVPASVRRVVTFELRSATGAVRVSRKALTSAGRATARIRVPAGTWWVRAQAATTVQSEGSSAAARRLTVTPARSTIVLSGLGPRSTQGRAVALHAVVSSPVRPGRMVTFQINRGTAWLTLDRSRTDAAGGVSTRLVLTSPTTRVRAVLSRDDYSAAARSTTLSTVSAPATPAVSTGSASRRHPRAWLR